jgi:putative peptidoglycan lipid II flippase
VEASAATSAARDSVSVAAWTMVSRCTGVLRVVAIGAVFGPTALGNTFQFASSLPNLVYYGFLAGSMSSSLLVPALVASVDAGDRRAVERIAGGFLGLAQTLLLAAVALAVLLGPLVLYVGTVGAGTAETGAAQERVVRLLLLLLMPQALLYALVSTATAVMNAHRRFALAAAAPALENLGLLVVLGVVAVTFGTGLAVEDVPSAAVVVLGAGATGAVAAHAALQWWGARRAAGVVLRPRAGWRDPDVVLLAHRALPALGLAGLTAAQLLTLLVLANRMPGGVVAAQMGLTFYYFVVALAPAPVALALLPRLARMHHLGEGASFHAALLRGVSLVLFVVLPAAVGLLLLAVPLAQAITVGRMGTSTGTALVAASVTALAPGLVGEALFLLATYGCFARRDTRSPLRSMLLQTAVFAVLAVTSLFVEGAAVLLALGLAFSVAAVVGGFHLASRLLRQLGGSGTQMIPRARRSVLGAALMAGPVWGVVALVTGLADGGAGALLAVAAATAVGVAVFVGLQAWWRAPELGWLLGRLPRPLRRHPPGGAAAEGGEGG